MNCERMNTEASSWERFPDGISFRNARSEIQGYYSNSTSSLPPKNSLAALFFPAYCLLNVIMQLVGDKSKVEVR